MKSYTLVHAHEKSTDKLKNRKTDELKQSNVHCSKPEDWLIEVILIDSNFYFNFETIYVALQRLSGQWTHNKKKGKVKITPRNTIHRVSRNESLHHTVTMKHLDETKQ